MKDINKIYNEDCIIGMQEIADKSVDMILTDMPYGITACEWDETPPLYLLWRQFERVIKDNGAIVLTSCQPFTTDLINSNPKRFRYCWYWIKNQVTGFNNSHRMPLKCVEDICVFYKYQPMYNPQGLMKLEKEKHVNETKCAEIYARNLLQKAHIQRYTNFPKQVLNIKCERGLHPTQKPTELFEYLIRTYTNPGELVLDAFMGSGTTKVACLRSGRNYIGFETEKKYIEIANERR